MERLKGASAFFAMIFIVAVMFNEAKATSVDAKQMLGISKWPKATDSQNECGSVEQRHVGTFTLYDYSVVFFMLVISLGIGVFYGFFNKSDSENSSSDFLHGTEMSLLPVTLSLTTSFITAIELLGNPSEMVFNGTQYSLIGWY